VKNKLVKNPNFGQKSNIWSKIESFAKINWSKIVSLVKNGNFGQKWKFWSKMENLVKNRNFSKKSKSLQKLKK